MYNIRNVTKDVVWLGGDDRRLALFENVFPLPKGVSYNSYLLTDEKTVLLDTADEAIAEQFFDNLEAALKGRKLDYLIVNHMEPDHCFASSRSPPPLSRCDTSRKCKNFYHDFQLF